MNVIQEIDDYVNKNNWEIKENSNMSYSLQGMDNQITEKAVEEYWLNKIYTKDIKQAHEQGYFHIHDLGRLSVYCVGWDLEDILKTGFKGVRGKIASKPAKHLDTALLQLVNFMYTLQGEAAGAQAVSNFDTYMAPFIHYDDLTYEQTKQHMQKFIFNINVPTRVGFQTPFVNLSMDLKVPSHMEDKPVIIGGETKDKTYGDFQEEVDMINKAYAEIMMEGDAQDRPFTFPIPTYSITEDFDWENPTLQPVWKMTAKYGIPYFSNYINSDMSPEDTRSMCCRLRLSNRELEKRGGGLFGSNPLTGSIGVVTINLPKLAYLSNNKQEFFQKIEKHMKTAKNSLEIKRDTLETLTEKGLYPYSKFYLRKIKEAHGTYWENHFSTIGLIGMNEAAENLIDQDITTKQGHKLAQETLKHMREKLKDFQEKTGNLYNLEATPGEGSSYKLALKDKENHPDIKQAGENEPMYTNSTHPPDGKLQEIHPALEHQDPLQTAYTGGTVFHTWMGEKMPSPEATKKLVKNIATNYELPYYTLTPTFSICPDHGYINGEQPECPECGAKTEVYSRVVGYMRPVQDWNPGKTDEFHRRSDYK